MELAQLRQMQSLPLDAKVALSTQRIRGWHQHYGGKVYVSFSGGKDSTVLLHMVRSLYPDVPAVFSDTGLEFPEIREFVKTIENVTWLKPDMTFRDVLDKYGLSRCPTPTLTSSPATRVRYHLSMTSPQSTYNGTPVPTWARPTASMW